MEASLLPWARRRKNRATCRRTLSDDSVQVYHSGGNNDVTTLVMFAPHDRVGLVILINQEGQTANFDIGWTILRKAFGAG